MIVIFKVAAKVCEQTLLIVDQLYDVLHVHAAPWGCLAKKRPILEHLPINRTTLTFNWQLHLHGTTYDNFQNQDTERINIKLLP